MLVAVGVKLTLWPLVPTLGRLVGFTHTNAPSTLTEPPDNTELLNSCPYVIGVAVGQLLITGVPLAMTNVAVWLVVPNVLLAVSVAVLVPALIGVPLIKPLVEMESPVGRLYPLNVIGVVPLAVTVLLNVTPTCPRKELVEEMTGAEPKLVVMITGASPREAATTFEMPAGMVRSPGILLPHNLRFPFVPMAIIVSPPASLVTKPKSPGID